MSEAVKMIETAFWTLSPEEFAKWFKEGRYKLYQRD